ncbi:hypothetical protein ACEN9F_28435 [Duganella sp. CT11-25]|uniref:hypothetical protein n=1 Tax=unclassified Duganella TaxID=2636909 RepID=UPI0039AFB6A1
MNIFRALFGKAKTPVHVNSAVRTAESSLPAAGEPPTDTTPSYLAPAIWIARNADTVSDLEEGCRHYSGYVREAALRRCVELAWPESLPLVVDRLNDWVPQIRDLARQALMTLLPFVSAPQLLSVLPPILRLHSAGRVNHGEWMKQFELALIQTVAAGELVAAAQGPDVKVARACVQILDRYELLEATALIELILSRNDDIVLANHAAELCARLPREKQGAQYRMAARSHFGSVRTIAIRALLAMEDELRLAIAIDALSDVQASVRSVAMSYLAPLDFDLRAHYRNILQQQCHVTKVVRISLSALASLRHKDDVGLVQSFLDSDRISIRLAALAAWAKLAEHDKDLVASRALADAAPGIRRFALQLVRKHGAYMPFTTIQSRLEELGDVELLLLFAESKKWIWLDCIARLSLQRSVEESINLRLDRSLKEWMQTSGRWYEQPDAGQLAYLSSEPVISSLAKLLGSSPDRYAHLREVLAHHGLPVIIAR